MNNFYIYKKLTYDSNQGEILNEQFSLDEIYKAINNGFINEYDLISYDGYHWINIIDGYNFYMELYTDSLTKKSNFNLKLENIKNGVISNKSRSLYIILGLLFGYLGIHNFYIGDKSGGNEKLLITFLSFGLFGFISWLLALVDITSDTRDAKGCKLK